MKTTQFLLAALLLSTGLIVAQSGKKPMTVRIKKIEKINGVEKVTDTTYTTTDYNSVMPMPKPGEIEGFKLPESGYSFTMDGGEDGSEETVTIRRFSTDEKQDLENKMQWISSEMEKDLPESGKGEKLEKMIFVQSDCSVNDKGAEKTSPKKIQKVIIIRKVQVTDPSKEELKSIGQSSEANSKDLMLKNLEFAPNPSNGIIGITLEIATKGPTDLTIYNLNGQVIYQEDLGDFTGRYSKELDLSGSPKGIYFLKVTQNGESLTKKLILE